MDFRKAYDSVWRQALLYKLLKMNIRGKFYKIVENIMSDVLLCVKIGQHHRSDFFDTGNGLKQGDVMSPMLFNLFVNDLPNILGKDINTPTLNSRKINCLMYADDLVIFSKSAHGLQKSLDRLSSYCDTWKLNINLDKTKVMLFQSNGNTCKNIFTINNTIIECVTKYTYLGVVVSASGSYSSTIDAMCDKATRALFKLKKTLKDCDVNPQLMLYLYDSTIKPIVLYGSEIWGLSEVLRIGKNQISSQYFAKGKIEKLQLNFFKYILGVNKKASNFAVLGELGKFPLFTDIFVNIIKYWVHIVNYSNNHVLNDAYVENCLLRESGSKNCWSYKLMTMLKNVGLDNVNPSECNVSLFKSHIQSKFISQWKNVMSHSNNDNNVSTGNKLRTLALFKGSFIYEPYLNIIQNKNERKELTRLRISAHKLAIESGRYTRPYTPVYERKCKLCDIVSIEDEKHFLTECNFFRNEREVLYKSAAEHCILFTEMSDMNKLIYLLSCEGKLIQDVAKYCKSAMDVRNEKLKNRNDEIYPHISLDKSYLPAIPVT